MIGHKIYKGIEDMPIMNWNKIHETGDLKYMIRDGFKLTKTEKEFLLGRWKRMYEKFIERFGFSDDFLSTLELEKNIALLRIEKAETGDENIQTFIEIDEIKLAKRKEASAKSGGDFFETKAVIETSLGFHVDPKKCTVIEFYEYIKTLKKKNGKNA